MMKTLAGLNTINLSGINTFQQIQLFLLIILGSAIFVSIGVVQFRKAAFERRFKAIVEDARQRRKNRTLARRSQSMSRSRLQASNNIDSEVASNANKVETGTSEIHGSSSLAKGSNDDTVQNAVEMGTSEVHGTSSPAKNSNDDTVPNAADENIERLNFAGKQSRRVPEMLDIRNEPVSPAEALRHRTTFFAASSPTNERLRSPVITFQGIGARQDRMNHPRKIERLQDFSSPLRISESRGRSNTGSTHRLGYPGVIGRNSQFSSLTFAEREQLGGAEYRAITLLAFVVPLYFILWQLLGALGLGAYVAQNRRAVAEVNGLNPWYELFFSLLVEVYRG